MPATKPRAYQVYDIDWKQAVRALSDTNIDLTSPGALVIDAVVLNAYDRVLLTAQTDATENGIYQVNAAQTLLVPAADWVNIDSGLSSAVNSGLTVSVTAGAEYAQTTWTLTTPNPIVIGTTTINFARTPDQISNVAIDGTNIELANNASETSISIRPSGIGGLVGITVPDDETANVANLHIYNLVANGNVKISTDGGDWLYDTEGDFAGAGNISAGYFVGNGSQLTGISALGSFIANGTSTVDIGTFDGNVVVTTNGANAWTFDTAGNLSLPVNGSIIGTTAGNSGSLLWEQNGNGLNVLKLIPDDSLITTDRYLVIDPYTTGHIHIRAGGIQDASNAYLFLGGDDVHVEVDDITKEIRIKTFDTVGAGAWQFSFDNDGEFVAPKIRSGGNIQGQYFLGNGSQLTGLPATYSNANVVSYAELGWAGNIIPNANATYSLGNATNYWANLWVANNTIYIGGVPLGITAGNVLTVGGNAVLSNDSNTSILTTGNITADYFFGNGSQLTGINVSTSSISNGNSNVAIATANGNVTVAVAGARTWTFDTTGNVTIPGNIVGAATIDIDNRDSGNTADINLYSADDILIQARDRVPDSGSEGGDINIFAGDSAVGSDATGGDVQIRGGDGGAGDSYDNGGSGGYVTIASGQGGAASASFSARSGGDLTLLAGDAGTNNGNIDLGAEGGDVVIEAGDSTGNGVNGGTIYLTSGAADASALAGSVVIQAGGTWTFDGGGNLSAPGNISAVGNVTGNYFIGSGVTAAAANSSVQLISNNENTQVRVDDANVEIYTSPNGVTQYQWSFGNNGVLGVAGNINFGGDPSAAPSLNDFASVTSAANFAIVADSANSYQTWNFDSTGNLTIVHGSQIQEVASPVPGNYALALRGTGSISPDQQLLVYPTSIDANHLHLTSGNLYNTELFLGNDDLYIKLANTGNVVVNTNDGVGNTAQYTFDSTGNLTVPGSLLLVGDIKPSGGASPAPSLSGFSSVSAVSLTALGNVTGNYILGNGALLTGIAANYGNANVSNFLANGFGSNSIVTDGNIIVGSLELNGIGDFGSNANIKITGGTYGQVLVTDGNGNLSWGNANGIPVMYAFAITSNNKTGLTTGSTLIFDTLVAQNGSIPYNSSTGVFSLQGGVTYHLWSDCSWFSFSDYTGGYVSYSWVDANSNTVINGSSTGTAIPISTPVTPITRNEYNKTSTEVLYTPISNQDVKVQIIGASGNVTLRGSNLTNSCAKVVQMATTALGGSGDYGNANVATFLANGFGSNTITTTGNITGGNIIATANVLANGYARLTGTFDESQASTAGLYLGYAGGTPRIMFGTGNTNQTLEIDNDGGTLRFYKPGTTLASLTNTGNFSVTGNISGNTAGYAIGYRDIPQVTFSANATAALADAGKHYYSTTAGNLVLTLPDNSNVAFATGTTLTIVVNAVGNVLVNQSTGVSLYQAGGSATGNRVVGAYGMATVMKVAANTWVINGTGVY